MSMPFVIFHAVMVLVIGGAALAANRYAKRHDQMLRRKFEALDGKPSHNTSNIRRRSASFK